MQEMRSDAEIIALYKDGNEEIFKELVEKYTGAIFNFSARFIGKTEAVIQSSLIRHSLVINNQTKYICFGQSSSSFLFYGYSDSASTSAEI